MKPLRIGTALSAVAFAGLIAGCASPMSRSGSASKSANPNLALALRAQMALGSGDVVSAVDLAERAVENSPSEAAVRTLLGNAYFASGRFASAEGAYRDSLSLAAAQPEVILKLALVQIAQGKNNEAVSLLESARGAVDAADHGLALALAGQTDAAVALLDVAARARGADARVRQNLALAHALSGNWEAARTVAAQDLRADLVDARVQQWMAFVKPVRASDQVAALTGVAPAASDPGQPVRLALNKTDTQVAAAAPAPAPVEVAQFAPSEAAPAVYAQSELPPLPAEVPPVADQAAPLQAAAAADAHAPIAAAIAATPAPAFEPTPAPRKALARAKKLAAAAKAQSGKAGVVVQLGAYSSPTRVSAAWNELSGRYGSLRDFAPSSARFDSSRGTVYRLSVKGFASVQEASSLCASLRKSGAKCFVRGVAGDAPVQIASR